MIIMQTMTSDERVEHVLASESRRRILTALRSSPHPLGTEAVAAAVGLRPATARFHLDLLASAGLVERGAERRAGVGRPAILYSAAAPGSGDGPGGTAVASTPAEAGGRDGYRELAGVLAGQIAHSADPAAAAREAGRRWADALGIERGGADAEPTAAVERVVGMLERLGFAPRTRDEGLRIDLRRCPFEEVARQQRGVVCGAHAALTDETLQRLGGRVRLDRLEPFVSDRPLLCVLHLRRADAGTSGGAAAGIAG